MVFSTHTRFVKRRQASFKLAAFVSGPGLAAMALHGYDYKAATHPGLFPHCVFHDVTGLLCPGCGATHALAALTHGDVFGALHANALIVLLLPMALLWAVIYGNRLLKGQAPWQFSVDARVWIAIVSLVAVFTITRNLAMGYLGW